MCNIDDCTMYGIVFQLRRIVSTQRIISILCCLTNLNVENENMQKWTRLRKRRDSNGFLLLFFGWTRISTACYIISYAIPFRSFPIWNLDQDLNDFRSYITASRSPWLNVASISLEKKRVEDGRRNTLHLAWMMYCIELVKVFMENIFHYRFYFFLSLFDCFQPQNTPSEQILYTY